MSFVAVQSGVCGDRSGRVKARFLRPLTAASAEHEETCPAAHPRPTPRPIKKGVSVHRPYTQSPRARKPVRKSMAGRKAGGAEAEQFDAGPD